MSYYVSELCETKAFGGLDCLAERQTAGPILWNCEIHPHHPQGIMVYVQLLSEPFKTLLLSDGVNGLVRDTDSQTNIKNRRFLQHRPLKEQSFRFHCVSQTCGVRIVCVFSLRIFNCIGLEHSARGY